MDFDLTDEQRLIKDTAREFADKEIVVQCRSGARSQRIAEFLKQSGYTNVVNLAGGILAWADEIDPKVQKY